MSAPPLHRTGTVGSSTPRDPGDGRRRRTGRAVAGLGVLALIVALAGCTPDPQLRPLALPGADWTAFYAMNGHGLAAGTYSDGDVHAFVHDTATATTTDVPDPPATTGLPPGARSVNAFDVDDSGRVVVRLFSDEGDRIAVFDTRDGTWTDPGCDATVRPGRGMLSNSGLLVCGDHVHDLATGDDLEVPIPDGCEGRPWRVNSSGVVIGTCTIGPHPLFATRVDAGPAVTFGAHHGAESDTPPTVVVGVFDDVGHLVVTDESADPPRAGVFLIGADPVAVPPEPVDLGPFGEGPSYAWAISPGGLLAVGHEIDGAWHVGTYDVTTGRIRAWDTSALPVGIEPPDTFVFGIDDRNVAVGMQVTTDLDQPFRAFVGGPD